MGPPSDFNDLHIYCQGPADKLTPLVEKFMAPGSIIHSDCWKAYDSLNKTKYTHYTVNHSKNFVDPDTGVHTQNIERLWRDIRGSIPKYCRRGYNFKHYLAEFMFKQLYSHDKR